MNMNKNFKFKKMKTKEEIEIRISKTKEAIKDNEEAMSDYDSNDLTVANLEDDNLKLRYRIKVLSWVLN